MWRADIKIRLLTSAYLPHIRPSTQYSTIQFIQVFVITKDISTQSLQLTIIHVDHVKVVQLHNLTEDESANRWFEHDSFADAMDSLFLHRKGNIWLMIRRRRHKKWWWLCHLKVTYEMKQNRITTSNVSHRQRKLRFSAPLTEWPEQIGNLVLGFNPQVQPLLNVVLTMLAILFLFKLISSS